MANKRRTTIIAVSVINISPSKSPNILHAEKKRKHP
jgi:hypothetical protein